MPTTLARLCVACGAEKSPEEFPWADKKRGFRRRHCRPCYATVRQAVRQMYDGQDPEAARAAHRAYHAANREKRNAARSLRYYERDHGGTLRRRQAERFGITVEQYNEMLERQDGVCAVCQEPETVTCKGTVRALAVDHDHDTGRVRGLLCQRCNVALGMLGDDPGRFSRAFDYLTDDKT